MEPELTPTMPCPHCGRPVAVGTKFCPACGNAIPESAEPAEPAAAERPAAAEFPEAAELPEAAAVPEAPPPPPAAAEAPEFPPPPPAAAEVPESLPPPPPDASEAPTLPPPEPTYAETAQFDESPPPPPPPPYPAAPGYVAAPGAYPVAAVSGKRVTAGVLGILLGAWGIHRFYLGDTMGGILRIVITIFTCGIGGVIGLIEGIIYLTKSDPEFDYEYLVQRKEWF